MSRKEMQKRRRNTRGESLVEVIVSFSIVLLTLVTITAVVQLSIRLNNRAILRSEAMETAATRIEAGEYDAGQSQAATIGIQLEAGDPDPIVWNVNLHRADMFCYFAPVNTEGG